MRIQKVRFGKLVSYGNYDNCRVEVEAEVENGESPQIAIAKAREWVSAELIKETSGKQVEYMSAEVQQLKQERDALLTEVEKLRKENHLEVQIRTVKNDVDFLARRLMEI